MRRADQAKGIDIILLSKYSSFGFVVYFGKGGVEIIKEDGSDL